MKGGLLYGEKYANKSVISLNIILFIAILYGIWGIVYPRLLQYGYNKTVILLNLISITIVFVMFNLDILALIVFFPLSK